MAPEKGAEYSQPDFLDQSAELISTVRNFSTADFMEFMSISEKLAELNRQRFSDWNTPFTPANAQSAAFAFTGDVYDGLDAPSLNAADLHFAQQNLRILSGLYGLLRPLDLIQPYRLEMGRPLKTSDADNLYGFWTPTITAALNQLPGELVLNLASQEYFKAVDKKALNKQIISPVFKDEKNGKLKIISFYAKRARGLMARFVIENRITNARKLTAFNLSGYSYAPDLSSETTPVFTRSESP
jgi:cytoplasmic iron level regulating protein YaaA (DUF328/UPF0246 family)